jgi:hypothetical protein
LPKPNGWRIVDFLAALTSPTFSITWLMTSVAEWIVSANKVGEPVVRNPNSLDAVMMLLVAIDTLTDFDMAAPRGCVALPGLRRSRPAASRGGEAVDDLLAAPFGGQKQLPRNIGVERRQLKRFTAQCGFVWLFRYRRHLQRYPKGGLSRRLTPLASPSAAH